MNTANKYLTEKNYPIWTQVPAFSNATFKRKIQFVSSLLQVNRIVDGGEPTLFKQYFSSWKEETLESHHHLPIPVAIKNDRIAGKLIISILPFF